MGAPDRAVAARSPYNPVNNWSDMPGDIHTVNLNRYAASTRAYMTLFVTIAAIVVAACASDDPDDPQPTARIAGTPVSSGVSAAGPEAEVRTAATPASVDTSAAEPEVELAATFALAGLEGWANADPFTIADRTSEGDVVLIDFWTYTCVNCIRTFPFLNEWQEKYSETGLTILGVHTPEFEFEEKRENVLKAIERFGLEYAVAQDNDRQTWDAFENRAWPSKYLFDSEGTLIYEHIGEGDYLETEQEIRSALTAAGRDVSGIAVGSSDGLAEDETAYYLTEELYAGYSKVYGLGGALTIAPVEFYQDSDYVFDYQDEEFHHFNKIYLQGPWLNEKDAIVHARSTTDLEDYLYAHIFARSANVVVEHRGDAPIDVYVELDGEPVPVDGAGPDIVYDETGASLIRVDESRLYALLELPEFGEHELVVRSNSDQFAVNAFTFGNYVQGP